MLPRVAQTDGADEQTDRPREREGEGGGERIHQLAVQRLLWRVFKMVVLAINCSFDFANLDCHVSVPLSLSFSLSLSMLLSFCPSIIMMRLSTGKRQPAAASTSSKAGIAHGAAECGSRTKCDLLAKPNNKLQKQLIGFNVHLVCDWL